MIRLPVSISALLILVTNVAQAGPIGMDQQSDEAVAAPNATAGATVSSQDVSRQPNETRPELPQAKAFVYPQWPNRKQVKREVIPPPPPGPYMSSALSEFSVKGRAFDTDFQQRELDDIDPSVKVDANNVPMDYFSPDRPWPKYLRKAKRWMPQGGYTYVQPPAMQSMHQGQMPTQPYHQSNMPMNAAQPAYRFYPPAGLYDNR